MVTQVQPTHEDAAVVAAACQAVNDTERVSDLSHWQQWVQDFLAPDELRWHVQDALRETAWESGDDTAELAQAVAAKLAEYISGPMAGDLRERLETALNG